MNQVNINKLDKCRISLKMYDVVEAKIRRICDSMADNFRHLSILIIKIHYIVNIWVLLLLDILQKLILILSWNKKNQKYCTLEGKFKRPFFAENPVMVNYDQHIDTIVTTHKIYYPIYLVYIHYHSLILWVTNFGVKNVLCTTAIREPKFGNTNKLLI